MKVVMDSHHPRRFWVSSETEQDVHYIVDLCQHELGLDDDGNMLFNGWCGGPYGVNGCRDFRFRCEPQLKKPMNMGKVFRCKHIKCARDKALDIILPHIKRTDPNVEEDQQV